MSGSLAQQVGDVFVIVHPSGAITNDEYNRNLEQMRAWSARRRDGVIVVWGDGTINSAQRAALMSFVNAPTPSRDGVAGQLRMVLFTSSTLTRGILQALAWMGARIAPYPKRDIAVGLRAEQIDEVTIVAVERAVARMDEEIRASRGIISSSHV